VSSLSPRLYGIGFRPMFAMPQIDGYPRAIRVATQKGCVHLLQSARNVALSFIQGTSEIVLRAAERAERGFAAFADIPSYDRHRQRELERLLNDMQGES
jgi:hypothetical protein